jgi:ribonuclease R
MELKKFKRYQGRIISLLKKRSELTTEKEIRQILGVKKHHFPVFEKALDDLVQSRRIVRDSEKKGYQISSQTNSVTGELRITRGGFGFVTAKNNPVDVYVGRDHLNTAFDRDIVEVKLYAKKKGKNLEGFVTKIVERKKIHFVGTFHQTEYYGFVVPDDQRVYRDFFIAKENQKQARDGHKVLVEMQKWDTDHLNPEGKILEIIGFPGEPGVDVTAVAYSFNIPVRFPEEVEKEAGRIEEKITADEIKKRTDLRELVTFTIDPQDARDYDDAISLEKLENGNLLLGVHIADVSYYVAENSKLDVEAFKRGTSTYLVDMVIPMLPEKLSNKICSLTADEDKLTYSCLMEIDRACDVVAYEIVPSLIKSKKRFTYENVQKIFDSGTDGKLQNTLAEMRELSRRLTEKRFEEGGIDFETPEITFELDEKGFPEKIIRKERLESHRLVEEFMLMANKTVAAHIKKISPEKARLPFIYRVHEKPDQEKMKNFFDFLKALEIKFHPVKKVTSFYLQKLLSSIKGTKEEFVIEEVALRSMMKAVYGTDNIGHFGLGFHDYTHFTSPIRRYPDLVVHRLLKKYAVENSVENQSEVLRYLKRVCDQSNTTERTAMEAERESIKKKQVEYISRRIGNEYTGVISGVMSFGIFVELIDTLVEGLVHIKNLEDDFYLYDEKTYTLVGRDSNRLLRLGDEVKIRVDKVSLEDGKVDFMLIG